MDGLNCSFYSSLNHACLQCVHHICSLRFRRARPRDVENVESRLKKQIYSASESGNISSLKRIVAEGRKLFDDDDNKDRFDALFDSNERNDGRPCTPLVISAKKQPL